MSISQLPQAMRQAVVRAREAMQPADEATRAQRTAICQACPHLQRTPAEWCGRCGCPIQSKTHFLRASCPDSTPRW